MLLVIALQSVYIEVKDVNLRFIAIFLLLGGYHQQSRKAINFSALFAIPLPHFSKRINRKIIESDCQAKR